MGGVASCRIDHRTDLVALRVATETPGLIRPRAGPCWPWRCTRWNSSARPARDQYRTIVVRFTSTVPREHLPCQAVSTLKSSAPPCGLSLLRGDFDRQIEGHGLWCR